MKEDVISGPGKTSPFDDELALADHIGYRSVRVEFKLDLLAVAGSAVLQVVSGTPRSQEQRAIPFECERHLQFVSVDRGMLALVVVNALNRHTKQDDRKPTRRIRTWPARIRDDV